MGRNNRNSKIKIWPFIAALIALNIFGDVFFDLVFLFFDLLPLVLMGLLIATVVMTVSAIKNGDQNKGNRSSARKNARRSSVHETGRYSNREIAMIDRKLKDYFEKNSSLLIADDIALSTVRGFYTSVDELFLTYKDEKVVKMSEYKLSYREVYNQITDLLLEFAKEEPVQEKREEENEKRKAQFTTPDAKPEKKKEQLSTAVEYINKIDALNKAIPNEEITNGLYQTCDLLKQIDLSTDDKKDEKLKKLYEYYLPILVSILEKYHELDSSPIRGEEFETCQTQLIKTILLINQALRTIYGSLHEEDYMNLNADITTLQSLLKKDGLVQNPFGGDDHE